jgi:uncharacterized protein YjiS (DUF1127 family)
LKSIEHGVTGRTRARSALHAVTRFLAALGDEVRVRRDIARLEAMSDRDLADIGVNRGGIRGSVRHRPNG